VFWFEFNLILVDFELQIREGMTILSALSPDCPFTSQTRAILLALFTPISRCRFLDEKHFDACTAVSASGPAFSLVILEAIADGGVMMGLPRAEALELAAQGMIPLTPFSKLSDLADLGLLCDVVQSYARRSTNVATNWFTSGCSEGQCDNPCWLYHRRPLGNGGWSHP
jgi:hypothetical protein